MSKKTRATLAPRVRRSLPPTRRDSASPSSTTTVSTGSRRASAARAKIGMVSASGTASSTRNGKASRRAASGSAPDDVWVDGVGCERDRRRVPTLRASEQPSLILDMAPFGQLDGHSRGDGRVHLRPDRSSRLARSGGPKPSFRGLLCNCSAPEVPSRPPIAGACGAYHGRSHLQAA